MPKMFKINDASQKCGDVVQHAEQFLPFAHKKMGFQKPISINLISDPKNAKNPLGKTAYYDPNELKITVFVDNRHLKDILRSLAHELVHHTQNCRGDLGGDNYTGPGYAQKDKHMRKMEGEAYLSGNLCFRDWEDSLKGNMTMAENKNQSLKRENKTMRTKVKKISLKEADEGVECDEEKKCPKGQLCVRGFCSDAENKNPMDQPLDKEGPGTTESLKEGDDETAAVKKVARAANDMQKKGKKSGKKPETAGEIAKRAAEKAAEAAKRAQAAAQKAAKEAAKKVSDQLDAAGAPKRENWTRKNKDELLFERLVKKWAK